MSRPPRQTPAAGTKALHMALGHAISDKRLEVLRRIGTSGSISQAAREAGISYKAAWQAIETLTGLSGAALVERSVGGSGGGGARLTNRGEQLLVLADDLSRARDAVLARHAGASAEAPVRARLGVQTSMRNQVPATVLAVEWLARDDPQASIRLRTDGGHELVSFITRESADLLGLKPGLPVLLLCKATAVAVVVPEAAVPADHGQLPGKVWRVTRGGARDEVTLSLEGGATWTGFADHPFTRRKGQAAVAIMAGSALVIALSGH